MFIIAPITNFGEVGGGWGGGGAYWNQVVRLAHLCPDEIFRTTKLYATKIGRMGLVHHHDQECHANRLGSYLQG